MVCKYGYLTKILLNIGCYSQGSEEVKSFFSFFWYSVTLRQVILFPEKCVVTYGVEKIIGLFGRPVSRLFQQILTATDAVLSVRGLGTRGSRALTSTKRSGFASRHPRPERVCDLPLSGPPQAFVSAICYCRCGMLVNRSRV